MAVTMPLNPVCQEIVEFIVAGTIPSSVAAYRPSEAARVRVEDLIRREKSDGLSAKETAELDYMQLAKARARRILSDE